ncbi:hypothetical protein A7A78_14335 [Aequorivita soesokkakensis]|jgi:hypothetical protein|uniref:Secretion system C-terminal sorting domain-containing protein n=1 Tax=Aequorivita soesokkakensis TaxID=1385699 RepID=A0A1A9LDB0_9FLAO|nr:T9SS type A sorting domain-containing protein [Aequorivita soesokkakensis]OAD90741.1 hypothetical protein A7A78_14335 [Aequorivita soesokkakensis]
MKKITLLVTLFWFLGICAQNTGYGTTFKKAFVNPSLHNQTVQNNKIAEECDDVITCDNLENGVFINGTSGQKAAIDIPIDAQTVITINQIKVTLSSGPEPAFVHFKFYKSNDSIPTDIYQEITNTTIIASDSIGYEPLHSFVIRNVTLELQDAIVLNGAETTDRFWMSAISDANAWATTDGVSNGAGITGKAIAMGSDNFDWFTLGDIEGLYEIEAECELLGVDDNDVTGIAAVYPNPASNKLNIRLTKGKAIQQTDIFNITGQKIKSFGSESENLDISFLTNGLYFAKIYSSENQTSVVKFVVK